jgi:hypothetical protein
VRFPRIDCVFALFNPIATIDFSDLGNPPPVLHASVIDAAAHRMAHTQVRGFHEVPTEVFSDPRHPHWDGLLGETQSDPAGNFALPISGRASLDCIIAGRGNQAGTVMQPFRQPIRIVIHPKRPRESPGL